MALLASSAQGWFGSDFVSQIFVGLFDAVLSWPCRKKNHLHFQKIENWSSKKLHVASNSKDSAALIHFNTSFLSMKTMNQNKWVLCRNISWTMCFGLNVVGAVDIVSVTVSHQNRVLERPVEVWRNVVSKHKTIETNKNENHVILMLKIPVACVSILMFSISDFLLFLHIILWPLTQCSCSAQRSDES